MAYGSVFQDSFHCTSIIWYNVNGCGCRINTIFLQYPHSCRHLFTGHLFSWEKILKLPKIYLRYCLYRDPCNLRPPPPSNKYLHFKTGHQWHHLIRSNSILRPYFPSWMGGLEMQGPLYSENLSWETTPMTDHLSWRTTYSWQMVLHFELLACHQKPPNSSLLLLYCVKNYRTFRHLDNIGA